MTDKPKRKRRVRVPGVSPPDSRTLLYDGWNPATGEWPSVQKERHNSVASIVLSALRQANVIETAAEVARISPRTVHRWLERGRAASVAIAHDEEPDRMSVPETERPFFDFAVEVDRAEAASEVALVTSWNSAAKDSWQAAQKLLATRHRRRWSEPAQGVELTGANGGPLQIASDIAIAKQIAGNPEARRMASDLLALVTSATPPGGFDDEVEDEDTRRAAAALGD